MSKSYAVSGWASDAPTPAQVKELFAQIESGRVTKGKLQAWLRGEVTKGIQEWKEEWAEFYRKYFGLDVDLSGAKIPEQRPGFDRLIVVAAGLTLNQVYDVCAKHFPCWRYADDLDSTVTHNDRDQKNGTYAVWFRDRQEADEELKNLSADQLAKQKIPGATLMERLLHELKYWDETNKHLDVHNWTLCAGSRYSDGSVPSVSWSGDGLGVGWDGPAGRDVGLRSRSAVS